MTPVEAQEEQWFYTEMAFRFLNSDPSKHNFHAVLFSGVSVGKLARELRIYSSAV